MTPGARTTATQLAPVVKIHSALSRRRVEVTSLGAYWVDGRTAVVVTVTAVQGQLGDVVAALSDVGEIYDAEIGHAKGWHEARHGLIDYLVLRVPPGTQEYATGPWRPPVEAGQTVAP